MVETGQGQARSALATIRALAAAGYQPELAVSAAASLAAWSRSCARVIRIPPVEDSGFRETIEAELSGREFVTTLATSDAALLALGADVGHLVHQGALTESSARVGLETPPGEVFTSHEELIAQADRLDYPIVVKSVLSGLPVQRVNDGGRLRSLEHRPGPQLVQPFLRGELKSIAGVVWKGRLAAVVNQSYLRTWPVDCGGACAAVTIGPQPDEEERLIALLEGFEGVFRAQFANGYLLDLNPRVYGSLPLATRSGVNLPGLYCDLLNGMEPPSAQVRGRLGVVYQWLEGDLRHAFSEVARGGIKLGEAIGAVVPRRGMAHGPESLADPRPIVASLGYAMRSGKWRPSVYPGEAGAVTSSTRALPPLHAYGCLLLPSDRFSCGTVIEDDENWARGAEPDKDAQVVLWGRIPLRSRKRAIASMRYALRRERALRTLARRPPTGLSVKGVHRLAPPPGQSGVLSRPLRHFLYGGVLLELVAPGAAPSVLHRAIEAAGARMEPGSFKPGSDQAAVARVSRGDGQAILRIAPGGTASDPARAAAALYELQQHVPGTIPRVLGRGNTADASWVLESLVPGRPATRLQRLLFAEVVRFCAQLPVSGGPPTALSDDLKVLGRALPGKQRTIDLVMRRSKPLVAHLPGVVRHGDLWRGNLMVHRGRLTGVIDWDAWHWSSVPGVDLLHLFATSSSHRGRRDVGELWLDAPWASDAFLKATQSYWQAVELFPDDEILQLTGLAWWAGWAATAISRHDRLLSDNDWVRRNIDSVLDRLV